MKLIVILSGGMDSTTMLYELNKKHNVVGVLSFNYGQKHKKELNFASLTCDKLGLEHKIINLSNIRELLISALTSEIDIPEGHYEEENMKLTVVPFRNTIMLTIAGGYAVSKKADAIALGAHSGDHAIYPDCREEYVKKINELFKLADYRKIKVIAPYIHLNKISILKRGLKIGVPYEDTWTCYKGRHKSCGKCGSCQERLEAFEKNNVRDPLKYSTGVSYPRI